MAGKNERSTNDDPGIAEQTTYIKEEVYDEDYDLRLNYSYDDVSENKQEDVCYTIVSDSLGKSVKVDTDIDIKDELYNNLLRASNSRYDFTKINDPKRGGKGTIFNPASIINVSDRTDVKQEDVSNYSMLVSDLLDHYIDIETDVDTKNQVDNNLPKTSNAYVSSSWTMPILQDPLGRSINDSSKPNSDNEYISDESSDEEINKFSLSTYKTKIKSNTHKNISLESKRIRSDNNLDREYAPNISLDQEISQISLLTDKTTTKLDTHNNILSDDSSDINYAPNESSDEEVCETLLLTDKTNRKSNVHVNISSESKIIRFDDNFEVSSDIEYVLEESSDKKISEISLLTNKTKRKSNARVNISSESKRIHPDVNFEVSSDIQYVSDEKINEIPLLTDKTKGQSNTHINIFSDSKRIRPDVNFEANSRIQYMSEESSDEEINEKSLLTDKKRKSDIYINISSDIKRIRLGDHFESNLHIEYVEDESSDKDINEILFSADKTIRKPDAHNKNISSERRRNRQKDNCYFCKEFVQNFARHIIRKHKYEKDVLEIISKPIGTRERKDLLQILRKKGNFLINDYNCIKPIRNTNKIHNKTKLLPCTYCLGYYSAKYLWRHTKFCTMNVDKNVTKKSQVDAQNYLVRTISVDPKLRELVFPRMRADMVSLVAKKDALICEFGARCMKKTTEKNSINIISRKMRELAKLLIEIKEIQPKIQNLHDMLQPKYFESIIEAVKIVAKYDKQTNHYESPTFIINITPAIKQCCNLAILKERSRRNMEMVSNFKTMLSLLESQWKFNINDLNSKRNKITIVSLANDVKLLNEYLNLRSINASIQLTQDNKDLNAFNELLETIFCRLKLLNCKCTEKLQRILLDNFENDEFIDHLSPVEKILMKRFKRVVVRLEPDRRVPILLSVGVENDIVLLLKCRSNFVPEENPYLFGRPNMNTALCGHNVLSKFAKQCGTANPASIPCLRFRKHLSIITQVFHVSNADFEELVASMGYAIENEKVYELPDDVYHTAKIFKLLLLKEKGLTKQFEGKTLDEIKINLDDNLLSDVEDDVDSDEHEVEYKEINESISYKKVEEINNETRGTSKRILEPWTGEQTNIVRGTLKRILEPWTGEQTNIVRGTLKRILEPWTGEQKNLVRSYFLNHIKQKRAPKRRECDELKERYSEILENKSWEKIKVYIQNVYSKKIK